MTENHPITPSQELIESWIREANHNESMFAQVAIMGAHWGADRELDACCEWLDNEIGAVDPEDLRAERRPRKSSSIKDEALDALDELYCSFELPPGCYSSILKALEQLDD